MIGDRSPADPQPELVLASTSVYRRALLERLGVPFRACAPLCDEESFKRSEQDPRSLAESLAHAKAASLVRAEPHATIIGCDQVVSFQGQVFGKPGSFARAVDQLTAMAGQTHELITALVVLRGRPDLSPHRRDVAADAAALALGDRALCRGRSTARLCGRLQARVTRNRPLREDRVGRSHGHHGPAFDRARDDPARAGI